VVARQSPKVLTMGEPDGSFTAMIDDAVGAIGRAVRREVRRTMLALVAGLAGLVLVVGVGLTAAIVGLVRLGDALGRVCGQWFGDQVLADVAVGVLLLAVPLLGVLWLRLRSRW
jgi:hypothetical protein